MISLIAAAGLDGVIGKNNRLPWERIRVDIKHFQELTDGHTVVMGRNTWESLPVKPLPNRENIVLTSDPDYKAEGAQVVNDILPILSGHYGKHVFIIGGRTLYDTFMPYAQFIFLTRIFSLFDGDTYFPAIEKSEWEIKRQVDIGTDQSRYDLSFIVFGRTHHH